MKFNEAIEKFKQWKQFESKGNTLKGYELDLRQFCLYMRNPQMEEIKLEDVTGCFQLMTELGWKWNGFVTKSMALRKFFEFWGVKHPFFRQIVFPRFSVQLMGY